MGMFVNSLIPFDAFSEMASEQYYVDKSMIIDELSSAINKVNKYICITRPRRFGKSVMANMVASYYGKAVDAGRIFDSLKIAGTDAYREHLNKHNVIYIDLSEIPEKCNSYDEYIDRVLSGLKADLTARYKQLDINSGDALWDILNSILINTGEKFVFVMDEWDAVFHMPFLSENDRKDYLLFLKSLLKSKQYVELAYMTGVLPIAKYSSGSELNMFMEYNMFSSVKYSDYFGFLDSEVDRLYDIYKKNNSKIGFTREDLRIWYDGYHNAAGEQLYNPRSIVCALTDNQIRNYWTTSGPYDEIFYYIRNNIEAVRDDIVLMIAGEGVEASIHDYAAISMELGSRDEIYSAMVVYGLLTYDEGKVYIPNRELMEQFRKLVMTKESLGYIYSLANESERMLKATLSADTQTMEDILTYAHNTESPIFDYNSEIELAAVVNLVYLGARDQYRVEREDKAGKGFADFIFYPERRGIPGIILELKVGKTADDAIQQIIDKKYALRFAGKLGQHYTGGLLAVGIAYDKKSKKHSCKVIDINPT